MNNQSNEERQKDYNKFVAQLGQLDTEELLLLYIEAKTGSQNDIDQLPVRLLDSIYELGETLNEIYSDRVISGSFKKKG